MQKKNVAHGWVLVAIKKCSARTAEGGGTKTQKNEKKSWWLPPLCVTLEGCSGCSTHLTKGNGGTVAIINRTKNNKQQTGIGKLISGVQAHPRTHVHRERSRGVAMSPIA
ncbi:unnamed protein product, partial [Ectocarpus sp. 13 AM-2016]